MAVMLVIALALSLCVCGSGTPAEDQNMSEAAQNGTTAQTEMIPAAEAETTAEMESEPVQETEGAAFDNSWATNEFELQLGEPEFETWEVKGYTEGESWSIFVTEVTYDDVKSYASALRSYGFSLNEEERDNYGGLGYVFEADNANGYHAELYFEAVYSDTLKGSFSLEISKSSI